MELFPEEEPVLTVSELTAQIKSVLETGFNRVQVMGEISSLTRAGSGHVYLSLKDADAVVRCVIWRSAALRLRLTLEEGLAVIGKGRLSVYPPRGDYQLVLEDVQARGLGAQDLALRKLKERLARLGYFAPERKKRLPRFPRRLVLVTSPSGAAVRDILEILCRRWPPAEVCVCPVRVQGPLAAEEIAAALRRCNRLGGFDVLILGRGGGSNEDLAAFNQEIVARAIFESKIPVISAVGHEIDVTIADLVADRRALTPSEAAELATPDRAELGKHLQGRGQRLRDLMAARLSAAGQRLRDLAQRRVFRQPLERLRDRERRLDDWDQRLRRVMDQCAVRARQKLAALGGHLQSLSPLNVLARGYSLTRTAGTHVLRKSNQVQPGDRVETLLHEGKIVSRVEEVFPAEDR